MLEAITEIGLQAAGGKTGLQSPNTNDIAQFKEMLGGTNQATGAIQNFVISAENRLERGQLAVSNTLRKFDYRDSVQGLVTAMHESSMNSVSVQLTGKIGTKVSESFESLVKQQ